MDGISKLKDLNQKTFDAEEKKEVNGQQWDEFLESALSDDFWIRRSSADNPLQNRGGMIAHIRASTPAKRHVSAAKEFEDGDYGVVTSIVMLDGQSDKFHNIKVFARQPDVGLRRAA